MLRYLLVFLTITSVTGFSIEWENSEKIVGGNVTHPTEAPYFASLFVDRNSVNQFNYTCGGSIIKSNVVLTAATCVKGLPGIDSIVLAGLSYWADENVQFSPVDGVVIHEMFSEDTLDYNVALAFLRRRLNFNDRVQPISMAVQGSNASITSLSTIVGFGEIEENGSLSAYLKEIKLPLVDWEQCHEIYKDIREVTANMFCVGYLGRNDTGICYSDIGGPLVNDGNLTGMASWIVGCARPDYPAVFVEMFSVRDWIDEKVAEWTSI